VVPVDPIAEGIGGPELELFGFIGLWIDYIEADREFLCR
jgi:hypothetical protein